VATAVQVIAWRVVLPARRAAFGEFARRWGIGMALRLLGVVLIPVAAVLAPETLPPRPAALGYLGVLLPLLLWEIRLVR
jgi:hypothetical protein